MSAKTAIDIRQFVQEYFDAWKRSVTEDVMAYYAENIVIEVRGMSDRLEGKPKVADNFVRPFVNAFPGNVHEIVSLIHQGDVVVIEWIFKAVHTGPYGKIAPTGKSVNVPGCSLYTVAGRQITRGHVYFNHETLMQQLGQSC